MKAISCLTVGGFYKHLHSKDELLAEAIAALKEGRESSPRRESVSETLPVANTLYAANFTAQAKIW